MNCQNCGAENEPGARFCAECGAPLENEVEAVNQSLTDADDKTIVATVSAVDEAAKTVNVSREDLAAAAEAEAENQSEDSDLVSPDETEAGLAPPPSGPPPEDSDENDGGWMSRQNLIIAVVILVLALCCCCFFLAVGGLAGSGVLEELQRELNLSAIYLYLV